MYHTYIRVHNHVSTSGWTRRTSASCCTFVLDYSYLLREGKGQGKKPLSSLPALFPASTSLGASRAIDVPPYTYHVFHQCSVLSPCGGMPWAQGTHWHSLGLRTSLRGSGFSNQLLWHSLPYGQSSSSFMWGWVPVDSGNWEKTLWVISTVNMSSSPPCLRFLAGCRCTCNWTLLFRFTFSYMEKVSWSNPTMARQTETVVKEEGKE